MSLKLVHTWAKEMVVERQRQLLNELTVLEMADCHASPDDGCECCERINEIKEELHAIA